MTDFHKIQYKLQQFIKKYYTNELIKGALLFIAFGLLYFLVTLFIEYFLWLSPTGRSILFFLFLTVELALLLRFILFPMFKLFGLQKGITNEDASKIIGNHFLEVDDKLLNVLQLNESKDKSELFLASIEQKSRQLQPIPFKSAINFTNNRKYLKYVSIPVLIWFFTFLSGNNGLFKESLNRVVNYQVAYEPPAPFTFIIFNKELSAVEGGPFELQIRTSGSLIPENAQIFFDSESYFLKDHGNGRFSYEFENLKEPLSFYLSSNGVNSKTYRIEVIKTPVISQFSMRLNYPSYIKKRPEKIENTGNAIVPEGTRVTWNINAQETDEVHFIDTETKNFETIDTHVFTLTKQLRKSLRYEITTSNVNLKDYEKLRYNIQVVRDEFPKIEVSSDIDSVSRGPVQFAGQLSDDYGLSELELVYYELENKENIKRQPIEIKKTSFEEFYYLFLPEGALDLHAGKDYELYFEVFDNDAVNGIKSAKSQVFKFHKKTKQEISEDLLKEQKESLEDLDKNARDAEELTKDFEDFTDKLKKKSELEWNDKKEFEQFLKRQEQYQEMFEKQTDRLRDNLDELNENDETIRDKKEELQKRIEETKKLQKKEKLLEELKKYAEKLNKEGLIDKLDKLAERQKQEKRSLERLLEMTKRFYVEKKAAEIGDKLDSLSERQKKLSETEQDDAEQQKEMNKRYDDIQEDMKEMLDENNKLREPMDFFDAFKDERMVDELQQKATEKLENQNSENQETDSQENTENNKENDTKKAAGLYQKAAARKMKQMGQSLKQQMSQMQGEAMQENIETLRAILENLVTFSLDQEQLMVSLENVDAEHPEFPRKLKKQQLLKEHFEHIDDSLYVLSMRQPMLSSEIQKDLTEAHYNIDKSLDNIAENRMQQGRSNQRYTMTASNNLADMLSDMLNSMMNPNMGQGKGQGKPDFALPDIIKKQQGLSEQMKEGIEKANQNKGKQKGNGKEGEKEGSGSGGERNEQMSGEQYQIYQEQQRLREQLQQLMNESGTRGSNGNKALDKMKELEQQLLDKGFTNEVLQNMLQLEHELLKLEDARLKQGKDNKREATTNDKSFQERKIKELLQKRQFFELNELLNREALPLRTNYKKKVQEYFKIVND